jgi:hypothetical protein
MSHDILTFVIYDDALPDGLRFSSRHLSSHSLGFRRVDRENIIFESSTLLPGSKPGSKRDWTLFALRLQKGTAKEFCLFV